MQVFQTLINVLACNRRKQEALSVHQDIVKAAPITSDSESTNPGTELGDYSNAELSDNSEQATQSPEVSDNEALPCQLSSFGSIPPPPGLDAPCDPAARIASTDQCRTRAPTPLNSHAPLFVPGFATEGCVPATQQGPKPTRQTVSLLKGLLQEWEAAIPEEQVSNDDNGFSALQERLSKLTPQEAVMLRGFLESKDSQQKVAPPHDTTTQTWQTASTVLGLSSLSNQPAASTPYQFGPGVCGPVAVHMAPPPGTFSYNQIPQLAPRTTWKPPAEVGQTRSYTPFGSKSPGSSKMAKTVAQSPEADSKDTLRTNLRDLSVLDHERVILVRKINRLGLESSQVLEAYFSAFGAVERVMVSHSRAKSMFGHGGARVRPAGLGFLVMSKAEEAHSVLAYGSEHEVNGVAISVQPFESRPLDDAEAMDASLQMD
jgi:hypothetical protein